MEHVLLISKDAMCTQYLPVYGGRYWAGKTPNIDELAQNGTVFRRHYTAAPSTAMAFTAMCTGKYGHETGRQVYSRVENYNDLGGETLFDLMEQKGYRSHIIWSASYTAPLTKYANCFGRNTVLHDKLLFNQFVGPHLAIAGELQQDDAETERVYAELIDELDRIDRSEPVFLWVHFPHVFSGRTGYGQDIDIFDRFIGDARKRFGDHIFISADHGNNNFKNGKPSYGFDVFENAIRIPFIAPRMEGLAEYDGLTSNTDLFDLIMNFKIPKHDYVLSDTAFYQQPKRQMAIISGDYKFVYDKVTQRKALYDVIENPSEDFDLSRKVVHDPDRNKAMVVRQIAFYKDWEAAYAAFEKLDKIFGQLWKNGDPWVNRKLVIKGRIRRIGSNLKAKIKVLTRRKR